MSQPHEVAEPILNSAFDEPEQYWYIREGETPEKRPSAPGHAARRPAMVYPPQDQRASWSVDRHILRPAADYPGAFELVLVNLIRERLRAWRGAGMPGATRTTLDLVQWWTREGRERRLFFAQIEAALTIIFLIEARADFRQGVSVPRDEPSPERQAAGYKGFQRYACKMATGAGKTTVMGMLAAWRILNKIHARADGRFSDTVVVVCPNVTIRDRLRELCPEQGEASIYRRLDLVPNHLMPELRRGKVFVTNWHAFEPQRPQAAGGARVVKAGVRVRREETVRIGSRATNARGSRYMTLEAYTAARDAGEFEELSVEREGGEIRSARIATVGYVESDGALVNRALGGSELAGRQNLLVMNDEAHHAYRILPSGDDEDSGDAEDSEEEEAERREATVWVDGLDKVHKLRKINFCLDLSATPYFLGRIGQEQNKPFPWVVSDFGLVDAIESGLVKIPQLPVRDSSGTERPQYFNVWRWMLETQMTTAERGANRASPRPEAVLKYGQHPIAMLAGRWEEKFRQWEAAGDDPRPPVFILVCKNTRIAKVIYEWLAEGKGPTGTPPSQYTSFLNRDGGVYTIRVDSKVVHETDTGESKSDEARWMRLTLDSVGKTAWPADLEGRPIYPEGFEELARKRDRLNPPLHPPGRDVRCIVSVGMLTEGWDCNTVTHIIGIRPFMSQLLCEQVVGRGLRRASYEVGPDGKFTEEVAEVLGVPFEVIPFKAEPGGSPAARPKRYHIHALPERAALEIRFPRVIGYTQAVRNRVTLDWAKLPRMPLFEPSRIPPEYQQKGMSLSASGRATLTGPGAISTVNLAEHRARVRLQQVVFDVAAGLTKHYAAQATCQVPRHVLFRQLAQIVERYVSEYVEENPPADKRDIALSPYYGWLVEILAENLRPDTREGEAPEVPIYEENRPPGTTAEVDFWTSREPREVVRSHVNYVVPDTERWEQSAAYVLDGHERVAAFVKNAGLGFAIPYLHNGQDHEYVPDFIVRLNGATPRHLILEVKGWDQRAAIKAAAAQRWVAAVNADGQYGAWAYAVAYAPNEVSGILASV